MDQKTKDKLAELFDDYIEARDNYDQEIRSHAISADPDAYQAALTEAEYNFRRFVWYHD